jgi:DNA-directed RNA polymerase specialized sigma24 family protein
MTTRPYRPVGPDRTFAVDELFSALGVLRFGAQEGAAERDRAWLTVVRETRRLLPTDEDARQDALVSILESAAGLRATSAPRAAAWVRAVCRNGAIDGYRRRSTTRLVPLDDASPSAQCEDARPSPPEAAEVVVHAFLDRVDLHLATRHASLELRRRRRTQALAALRRTALKESLSEIAASLGLAISLELLAKWIERGRAVIVAAVEADRLVDPDAAELFEPFADLARKRRADAGLPRPGRRSSRTQP